MYRSDIWNTCCSFHRNLAICGLRKHSKYKWLFCCRLMIWVKPRCGFLWDCFSQIFPRISSWRMKENRLLFSIFICETKPEKMWTHGWCWRGLTVLSLVASGRLSFVNLLWPLYYLVCLINSKPTLKCNGTVPDHCIFTVCVCVCVSIGKYECVYV